MDKHYKGIEGRDIEELDRRGNYYIRHVLAMTGEGLHSKADIAAELGFRDALIDDLTQALERIGKYPMTRDEELSAESMRDIARDALLNKEGPDV